MIGGYTHRHMNKWEGFMKYITEMGSSAMMHLPSFIKTSSGNQKLVGGIHRHKDNMAIS
jgi:hypothetical protein